MKSHKYKNSTSTIRKAMAMCRVRAPLGVWVSWLLSALLLLTTQLPLTHTADSTHQPTHHNLHHQHGATLFAVDSGENILKQHHKQQQHLHAYTHQNHHTHQRHYQQQQQLELQHLVVPQKRQHKHQQQHRTVVNATHKLPTTTSPPTTITTTRATTTETLIKSTTTLQHGSTNARMLTKAATSKPQNQARISSHHGTLQKGHSNYNQHQQYKHFLPSSSSAHLRATKPTIAMHGGMHSTAYAHNHHNHNNHQQPHHQQQHQEYEQSFSDDEKDPPHSWQLAHNAFSALKHKSRSDLYAEVAAAATDDYYDYSDDEAYNDDAAADNNDNTLADSYDDDDDDDTSSQYHSSAAKHWIDAHGQEQYYDQQPQMMWRTRVTRDHHRFEPPPNNRLAFEDADGQSDDYQNDETTYEPGELSRKKQEELGTASAVQRSFALQQRRESQMMQLALAHRRRMEKATICSQPLPRVVHVSNDTSKTYYPNSTILHRCGEDTGCCPSSKQVCSAKSSVDVPLYFLVTGLNLRSHPEVLWMRNDTECHCIDRANRTAPPPEIISRRQRWGRALRRESQQLETIKALAEHMDDDNANENVDAGCVCPRYFEAVEETLPGAQVPTHGRRVRACRCECLNMETPCNLLKIGREGFTIADRKCISEGPCTVPTCSHGEYNHREGRCPHKRRSDFG